MNIIGLSWDFRMWPLNVGFPLKKMYGVSLGGKKEVTALTR